MTELLKRFPEACECLKTLYGAKAVNFDKLSRLFDECEDAWSILSGSGIEFISSKISQSTPKSSERLNIVRTI